MLAGFVPELVASFLSSIKDEIDQQTKKGIQ